MKICKNCGAKNPADAKFCSMCRGKEFVSDAVYLCGSFTNWVPQKMVRNVVRGEWEVVIDVSAGNHYYFKFADTPDWSGVDWGGCSDRIGTLVVNGGNASVYLNSGKYKFLFDENTLKCEIIYQAPSNVVVYPNPIVRKESVGDKVLSVIGKVILSIGVFVICVLIFYGLRYIGWTVAGGVIGVGVGMPMLKAIWD